MRILPRTMARTNATLMRNCNDRSVLEAGNRWGSHTAFKSVNFCYVPACVLDVESEQSGLLRKCSGYPSRRPKSRRRRGANGQISVRIAVRDPICAEQTDRDTKSHTLTSSDTVFGGFARSIPIKTGRRLKSRPACAEPTLRSEDYGKRGLREIWHSSTKLG